MISCVHALFYSPGAEAVRAFFREVLEWRSVDAGRGWLIYAMPPAELAVHPTEGAFRCELYLMCDDLEATMATLRGKDVEFSQPVSNQG
jgi:hypothetical protein